MTTYRRRKNSDTWHWCKSCRNYPNNPDDVIVTKEGRERPSYGELDNNCQKLEKKDFANQLKVEQNLIPSVQNSCMRELY